MAIAVGDFISRKACSTMYCSLYPQITASGVHSSRLVNKIIRPSVASCAFLVFSSIDTFRKINLSSIKNDILGPSSKEFEELNKFYTYKTINIKSFLGRDSHHLIEPFHNLFSQKLIFPYIELKNLGFREKLYLFIPEISKLKQNLLVKIFSFFNYVFLYEIESEFYIKGGKKIKP